jgi:DNA-binding MarR family transcriptional regulator
MTASREELMEGILARFERLKAVRRHAMSAGVHREVSIQQMHVLMALQEERSIPISDLAELLCISAPSASSIVDRLEERDLVRRVRDTEDRRVVYVELSEHGNQVVEEFIGLRRDRVLQLLAVMTDEELGDIAAGLDALQAALARLDQSAENTPAVAG